MQAKRRERSNRAVSIALGGVTAVAVGMMGIVGSVQRAPLGPERALGGDPVAVPLRPSSGGTQAAMRGGGAGWTTGLSSGAAAREAYRRATGERTVPPGLVVVFHAPGLDPAEIHEALRESGAERTWCESAPRGLWTKAGPLAVEDDPLALVVAELSSISVGLGGASAREGDDAAHVAHMAYLRALEDLSETDASSGALVLFRTNAEDVEAVRAELQRAAGRDARVIGERVPRDSQLSVDGRAVEGGTAVLLFDGGRSPGCVQETGGAFARGLRGTRGRVGDPAAAVLVLAEGTEPVFPSLQDVPWIAKVQEDASGSSLGLLLPSVRGRQAQGEGPGWSESWDSAWESGAR